MSSLPVYYDSEGRLGKEKFQNEFHEEDGEHFNEIDMEENKEYSSEVDISEEDYEDKEKEEEAIAASLRITEILKRELGSKYETLHKNDFSPAATTTANKYYIRNEKRFNNSDNDFSDEYED